MKNRNYYIIWCFPLLLLFFSCMNNKKVQESHLETLFLEEEYELFLSEMDDYLKSNSEESIKDVLIYKKAIAYKELGKFIDANKEIDNAISLDSSKFEYFLLKAEICEGNSEITEAVINYSKTIELNPDCDKAYNNRGVIYNFFADYDNALKDLNKALKLDSNVATYYSNRGLVYENLNEFGLAIIDYDKAILIDSSHPIFYYNKSVSQYANLDTAGALQTINQGIKLSPENDLFIFNRGVLFLQIKDIEQACNDFKEAARLGNSEANSFASKYCNQL